jgi:hypothetical protein
MPHRSPSLLILVAFALTGCATTRTTPVAPSPPERPLFMWRVDGPAGSPGAAYLLGSVHLRSAGAPPLPREVLAAFDAADALVVEVDMARAGAEAQVAMALRGMLLPGESLDALLSPETWATWRDYGAAHGLPSIALPRMQPWMAAMTVTLLVLQAAGFTPEHGVDAFFLERAAGRKDVLELESVAQQVEVLAGMPRDLQVLMLEDALAGRSAAAADAEHLIAAWQAGDDVSLERAIFGRRDERPELRPLFERLFDARNVAMAARIGALLDEPRTYFVVVGAGHLVGETGLVAALGRSGHRVTRSTAPP